MVNELTSSLLILYGTDNQSPEYAHNNNKRLCRKTNKIFIETFGPADHPHKLGHPASDDPRSRVTSTLDNDIYSFTLCFYCGG